MSPVLDGWTCSSQSQVLRSTAMQHEWLQQLAKEPQPWFVVSVNRQREGQLASMIRSVRPGDSYRVLTCQDFALTVDVDAPERVGTDRLAAALAAVHLRRRAGAVIVVDAGTALTVDRIDPPGIFRGGVIFPGMYLLAESLHRHTDALPLVAPPNSPPCPVGKNTEEAIRSGMYWGTVGAIGECIRQMRVDLSDEPELFFTGGHQQQSIASLIQAEHVADLVLRGVALAGARLLSGPPPASASNRS